jgi:predicted metal-dependent hydrolase
MTDNMNYELIYSNRKTLSVSVKGGIITVRAPIGTKREIIEAFIKKHSCWIQTHLIKEKERISKTENLTDEQIGILKKEARTYFTQKSEYYAKIMGLKFGRITITSARTRHGSCSSKGNISYSYRLMLYPEPAREYVIVHELSHLLEMNHSKRFYKIVERFMPDYKERRRMLK